jgi:hypothetical protein
MRQHKIKEKKRKEKKRKKNKQKDIFVYRTVVVWAGNEIWSNERKKKVKNNKLALVLFLTV